MRGIKDRAEAMGRLLVPMDDKSLIFRPMQPGEESQVCELIQRVFDEFVAPDFSPEGVEEFLKYADPGWLSKRSQAGHFVLVALAQDQIVGMIEMRNHEHVSLFFVDGRHLGQGIGKELWRRALAICRRHKPHLGQVTVNSSPYAVPIYEKLGFRPKGPEQVVSGIRFVPMTLER